jgi:glyoxylase-like metal-dependent hydrolase (beta-lactamase superfamily II)
VIDVHSLTVGPVQENAYIVRAGPGAQSALMVDPGEEPQRLLDAAASLGVRVEAILITHCHFDHVGAVTPVARATGAPVYCPQIELGVLADIMKWTMPGFGPFESYSADYAVSGGERLRLADLDVEVIFTPGHSPGHVTYAIAAAAQAEPQGDGSPVREAPVLLSGDVLFEGSVGRVDLPGGDWATLERSIGSLMEGFGRDTVVYPGHMGVTTLGREWDVNPFLSELRAAAQSPEPSQAGASGAGMAYPPQGARRAQSS